MSIFTLYLLFVFLPNLREFAGGPIWALLGIATVFSIISYGICTGAKDDEIPPKVKEIIGKSLRICLTLSAILCLLCVISPSSTQVYTIAGGYAVTNDAEMKKLPDNILRAANNYLENINKEGKKQPWNPESSLVERRECR